MPAARWTAQRDFPQVVEANKSAHVEDAKDRQFWLSVYPAKLPGIHGQVFVKPSADDPEAVLLDGGPEFRVDLLNANTLRVQLAGDSATLPASSQVLLRAAKACCVQLERGAGAITALDVSPGGGLLVYGTDRGGELRVFDMQRGAVRTTLKGHLADITVCRFFPSGEVVLSGSADMQLRVWSALDGECPVTMRGHHGRITDVAIVARGRNVLSASADGTVRLWEVASASELLTLVQAGSPVNKILLAAAVPEGIVVDGTVDTTLSSLPDERQVETAGKVVFYACENGRVGVSMVATGRKLLEFKAAPMPVTAIAYDPDNELLLTGTEKGVIAVWNMHGGISSSAMQPAATFQRNDATISSAVFDGSTFVLSALDGSVFRVCVDAETCAIRQTEELIADEDPVYAVVARAQDSTVWCGTRRGGVFKFEA